MESRGDGSWRLETGGLTRGSRECSPILSGSETRFCAPPNSRNQIKPSRPCLSFRLLYLSRRPWLRFLPWRCNSLMTNIPRKAVSVRHSNEVSDPSQTSRRLTPESLVTLITLQLGAAPLLLWYLAFISPLPFPVRGPWSVANTKAIESSDTDLLNPSSELAPTCVLPG